MKRRWMPMLVALLTVFAVGCSPGGGEPGTPPSQESAPPVSIAPEEGGEEPQPEESGHEEPEESPLSYAGTIDPDYPDMNARITAVRANGLEVIPDLVEEIDGFVIGAVTEDGERAEVEFAADVLLQFCTVDSASMTSETVPATLDDFREGHTVRLWGEYRGDVFVAVAATLVQVI